MDQIEREPGIRVERRALRRWLAARALRRRMRRLGFMPRGSVTQ